MNRFTVQLAVLGALGLTALPAQAGIPTGNIPELENAETETASTEPRSIPIGELVAQRWKEVHLPRLTNDQADVAKRVEAQLEDVPSKIGEPIDGTQQGWSGRIDLRTTEGRVDSVLGCLAMGLALEACDLNGVISADDAARRSGATRYPHTEPWLDRQLQWNGLGGTCTAPQYDGGCGSQIRVDARTATCHQQHLCRRGRPFEDGRVAELRGETRTAAGAAWVQVALDEHASIASFANHVLELMAIGAPTELLAAASQAQLDEVRHTQLALELARELGADVELGPLDTRASSGRALFDVLKSVARHGCIGETVSAAECAIALEQTDHPRIRQVLEQISADEAAHAALAWRTLAWGLPRLDAAQRAEILAVFAEVTVAGAPEVPAGIGVLGGSEAAAARTWALEHIVAPAVTALAS